MQQADATRIAALCDQQIVAMLDKPIDAARAEIIFGLADLRNMYAGAPDVSEMTPQTYGDGTPGAITGGDAADDHKMPAEIAGTILPIHQRPGETFLAAIARTQREAGWYQGPNGGS